MRGRFKVASARPGRGWRRRGRDILRRSVFPERPRKTFTSNRTAGLALHPPGPKLNPHAPQTNARAGARHGRARRRLIGARPNGRRNHTRPGPRTRRPAPRARQQHHHHHDHGRRDHDDGRDDHRAGPPPRRRPCTRPRPPSRPRGGHPEAGRAHRLHGRQEHAQARDPRVRVRDPPAALRRIGSAGLGGARRREGLGAERPPQVPDPRPRSGLAGGAGRRLLRAARQPAGRQRPPDRRAAVAVRDGEGPPAHPPSRRGDLHLRPRDRAAAISPGRSSTAAPRCARASSA